MGQGKGAHSKIHRLTPYCGNKNVLALWDGSAFSTHYKYDPFGNNTVSDSSYSGAAALNPMRFSNEYYDEETGLTAYKYRCYSPEIGRFLSRDPIEEQGGMNLYGFVGNEPVINYDHQGLLSIGMKIAARFGERAGRSASLVGNILNRRSQGPVTMSDDENEMNPALDEKVEQRIRRYISKTGKEGNVKIDEVDLNEIFPNVIRYEEDASRFGTGWWLNGAMSVIANGEAKCVVRSGGGLSIGSIDVNLEWHDWIDANPSGENFIKHNAEKVFGLYDKIGYVSWEIVIPWKFTKNYTGKD